MKPAAMALIATLALVLPGPGRAAPIERFDLYELRSLFPEKGIELPPKYRRKWRPLRPVAWPYETGARKWAETLRLVGDGLSFALDGDGAPVTLPLAPCDEKPQIGYGVTPRGAVERRWQPSRERPKTTSLRSS